MAFKAKDLHYEKQEPAFLRRLRAGNTDDRSQVSIARPRNPRLDTGEDEGPTIVDESGETVTLGDYKKLLDGKSENGPDVSIKATEESAPGSKTKSPSPDATAERVNDKQQNSSDKVTTGPKKRKQPKVIEGNAEPESPPTASQEKGAPNVKAKVKRRKVKLCFDETAD